MSDSSGGSGSTIIEELKKRPLLRELVEYAAKNLPGDLNQYSVTAAKGAGWYLFDNFTLFAFSSDHIYAFTHDRETGKIISDKRMIIDPNDPFVAIHRKDAFQLQTVYRDELPKGTKDLEEDENQETN